jgi:hypothetical protein
VKIYRAESNYDRRGSNKENKSHKNKGRKFIDEL